MCDNCIGVKVKPQYDSYPLKMDQCRHYRRCIIIIKVKEREVKRTTYWCIYTPNCCVYAFIYFSMLESYCYCYHTINIYYYLILLLDDNPPGVSVNKGWGKPNPSSATAGGASAADSGKGSGSTNNWSSRDKNNGKWH